MCNGVVAWYSWCMIGPGPPPPIVPSVKYCQSLDSDVGKVCPVLTQFFYYAGSSLFPQWIGEYVRGVVECAVMGFLFRYVWCHFSSKILMPGIARCVCNGANLVLMGVHASAFFFVELLCPEVVRLCGNVNFEHHIRGHHLITQKLSMAFFIYSNCISKKRPDKHGVPWAPKIHTRQERHVCECPHRHDCTFFFSNDCCAFWFGSTVQTCCVGIAVVVNKLFCH